MLEPRSGAGRSALSRLLADPEQALLAFDYDGTLAPIVDEPTKAFPEPRVLAGLRAVSTHVGCLAIVTGRPVEQLLALAGLADWSAGPLVVTGHYGLERWSTADREIVAAPPEPGLAVVRADLPALLTELGLATADIEDKGLSVAVHVRRLGDPESALATLAEPLERLAQRAGLVAQPGRRVIELRPAAMDKGRSLARLIAVHDPNVVVFTGDDLGDLPAFDEVERWRAAGGLGLTVCSGSVEVSELADRADLVVDGPAGVADFVEALADAWANAAC